MLRSSVRRRLTGVMYDFAMRSDACSALFAVLTVAMERSRSTPGLLESRGKKALEETPVRDDFLTRPKPMKASSTCSSPSGQRENHARSYLDSREQPAGYCASDASAARAQATTRLSGPAVGHAVHPSAAYTVYPPGVDPSGHLGPPNHAGRSPNLVQHVHAITHATGAMSSHSQHQHQQQPQPPSPIPHYLNLPATPHGPAGATTFTFQGSHSFIPISTGTPVLASRSSPYTDYTNISPVSSNEPITVAPPTALYGTSPGNSSIATGVGPSTHLLVPSPLQISGKSNGPTGHWAIAWEADPLLGAVCSHRHRRGGGLASEGLTSEGLASEGLASEGLTMGARTANRSLSQLHPVRGCLRTSVTVCLSKPSSFPPRTLISSPFPDPLLCAGVGCSSVPDWSRLTVILRVADVQSRSARPERLYSIALPLLFSPH
ncbi:cyclic nucleotide-gated olfactory channel-like [Tropilaelaps mercedesae]|uniref:Cyclic nucleotide-gated olfactory channel-like n=1 Tax=Tropilaelaps mercedesae TaxID=418985 RepID=A0A1V9XL76_9ACAR|nr:cyclic nucleotide-gated olfactory channel-like [Tropilaelaps mercedesae]